MKKEYWARWDLSGGGLAGTRDVWVYVPDSVSNATTWQAEYWISDGNGGVGLAAVDQLGSHGRAVCIGEYNFGTGDAYIHLVDHTGETQSDRKIAVGYIMALHNMYKAGFLPLLLRP